MLIHIIGKIIIVVSFNILGNKFWTYLSVFVCLRDISRFWCMKMLHVWFRLAASYSNTSFSWLNTTTGYRLPNHFSSGYLLANISHFQWLDCDICSSESTLRKTASYIFLPAQSETSLSLRRLWRHLLPECVNYTFFV